MIWSYISSCKKHNLSAFEAIQAAVDGDALSFLFDDPEIAELDDVLKNLDAINRKRFFMDREEDKQRVRQLEETAAKKEVAALDAEKKANEASAKAARIATGEERGVNSSAKIAKAKETAEKARVSANNKKAQAEKARRDAQLAYEDALQRAQAALYFLELKDDEWNFDEFMAC